MRSEMTAAFAVALGKSRIVSQAHPRLMGLSHYLQQYFSSCPFSKTPPSASNPVVMSEESHPSVVFASVS